MHPISVRDRVDRRAPARSRSCSHAIPKGTKSAGAAPSYLIMQKAPRALGLNDFFLAFGQAATAQTLDEAETFGGVQLEALASQCLDAKGNNQRLRLVKLAENFAQPAVLGALGNLLRTLVRLSGSGDDDLLLYHAMVSAGSILVNSETACSLASGTMLDAIFDVLMGKNGIQCPDIRQLAASALTNLDDCGRLNSHPNVAQRLREFAASVDSFLLTAGHISFQQHCIYLLDQAAKTGHPECRAKLGALEGRYASVLTLDGTFTPRPLLNAYNWQNHNSRVWSAQPRARGTKPMQQRVLRRRTPRHTPAAPFAGDVRLYGQAITPDWVDWNSDDVWLYGIDGARTELYLTSQDLRCIVVEPQRPQSGASELFWVVLQVALVPTRIDCSCEMYWICV